MAENNNHSISNQGNGKSPTHHTNEQYVGLIGLNDTNRLDSSLYSEQVDYDFFDFDQKPSTSSLLQQNEVKASSSQNDKTSGGVSNIESTMAATSAVVTPAITTNFHPETNSLLGLQIDDGQINQAAVVGAQAIGIGLEQGGMNVNGQGPSFSTQLLMAALKETQQQQQHGNSNVTPPPARVHLFDLTDTEDEDEEEYDVKDEPELAEIINHRNNPGPSASALWNNNPQQADPNIGQKHQHKEKKAKQKQRNPHHHRAFNSSPPAGLIIKPNNGSDDELGEVDDDSSSDEEGYYLSDSERSDITEVTPMSSVACSPMPPFGQSNYNGDDLETFDGFPNFHDDDDDDDEFREDELVKLDEDYDGDDNGIHHGRQPDYDDDDEDIDELLRTLPTSSDNPSIMLNNIEDSNGCNDDVSGHGHSESLLQMYRVPLLSIQPQNVANNGGNHKQVVEHLDGDYNNLGYGNSSGFMVHCPSASADGRNTADVNFAAANVGLGAEQNNQILKDKYLSSIGTIPTLSLSSSSDNITAYGSSGPGSTCSSGLIDTNNVRMGGKGIRATKFPHGANHAETQQQRRKFLSVHPHHHYLHHHHHNQHHGGGPKLNKIQHNNYNGHGHGHHGVGVHHGHHGHYHYNNYHQQYHNLTMALQRKRQSQQKQIEHDNSIMKRKLQAVKPSDDIIKAFGCTGGGSNNNITAASTPIPGSATSPNGNGKGSGVVSTTNSSVSSSSASSATTQGTSPNN